MIQCVSRVDVILFLCSALCFLFAIEAEFAFDDNEAIIKNPYVNDEISVIQLFRTDFWGTELSSKSSHKSFRPLTVLTFRFLKVLNKGILYPRTFHCANIILHGLICVLLNRCLSIICTRLQRNKCIIPLHEIPFMTSLLFAVHPIHSEAVCAAVGLADLMSAFFALMSLHKYLCFNGSKIKDILNNCFVVILLSTISMFFKEHGITILGVCCAAEVVFAINERKFSNFVWLHLLLLVSGCVVTVSFRCYLMNFEAPIFQEVDNPASFLESLLFRLLNYNYIYVLNAWIIIHPLWLCFDWSMGCVPLITSFLDLRLLSVFCFWFLFFTLIYQSFYSKNSTIRSLLQFCIIFIVIPFVPSSNLFFVVGFVVAERSLYLSSVGFCLLTVTGCLLLSSLKHPAIWKALFYCLCVLFAARCVQRSFDWLTEERLFSSGISVCPLNAKVHYNIAKLAADKGNKTLAVLEYKESLKLNSKYYHAMNNLANILKDLNQTVDAEYLLMNAVKLKPDFSAAWMNLGIVRSSLKKFSEAETNYLMALKLRKKYADCMFNLGNLYLEQKRFNDAILMWRNATKLKPKLVAAWINLLLLIDSIGETNDAITIAEEALNFIKEDSLLHFNYANLLGKMRRFEDAENHYLKAIRLKEEAIYFANLGVLYHQWNKLEAAKSAYEHALHLDPSLKITKDNIRILMKNAKIKK